MKKTEKSDKSKSEDKNVERDELDTETTFANMNVEGFSWYKPDEKDGEKQGIQLSRSEQRAAIRGALLAFLPIILGIAVVMAIVFGLAYLWLS